MNWPVQPGKATENSIAMQAGTSWSRKLDRHPIDDRKASKLPPARKHPSLETSCADRKRHLTLFSNQSLASLCYYCNSRAKLPVVRRCLTRTACDSPNWESLSTVSRLISFTSALSSCSICQIEDSPSAETAEASPSRPTTTSYISYAHQFMSVISLRPHQHPAASQIMHALSTDPPSPYPRLIDVRMITQTQHPLSLSLPTCRPDGRDSDWGARLNQVRQCESLHHNTTTQFYWNKTLIPTDYSTRPDPW